jgi:hypothetical protein
VSMWSESELCCKTERHFPRLCHACAHSCVWHTRTHSAYKGGTQDRERQARRSTGASVVGRRDGSYVWFIEAAAVGLREGEAVGARIGKSVGGTVGM